MEEIPESREEIPLAMEAMPATPEAIRGISPAGWRGRNGMAATAFAVA